MDKDRVKGKAKDVGRIQRQAGEWTGDEESQVKGAARQVEGKVQNIVGKAKDAMEKKSRQSEAESESEAELERRRRRA